jgi:predicted RNA-binding Zn-ribbon protein involved in translation (DUF1610 family)
LIRSTRHSLDFANATKLQLLKEFRIMYASAVQSYVDYLWSTRITFKDRVLDVSQGLYDCPSMLPDNPDIQSGLSGRALKCAATQACGIVQSVLKKRMKLEWKYEYCVSHKYSTKHLEKLLAGSVTKPEVGDLNPELNSIIVQFGKSENSFDRWLTFGSLFKDRRGLKVCIPLKNHRHSHLIEDQAENQYNSILLGKDFVNLRHRLPTPELKETGEVLAIDQGITDMLATSRRDVLPTERNGWTLLKILQKMSRLKWGSQAFKRAKDHLKNYINFVFKRLNLENVKEVKFEDIFNIKYGEKVSRLLKHWSNPLIRDSLTKVCENAGVLFTLVPNEYNSQRCNECGWTQKSNRKGKDFKCLQCGHVEDADHNASLNIKDRSSLPDIPYGFRRLKHNLKGFFWNPGVLCNAHGGNLQSPLPHQNVAIC